MVHGKNRIPYWIDRRLTGLAGPEYHAIISFGLPIDLKTPNMGNIGSMPTPLAGGPKTTKMDKKHGSRQESHPLSDRPEIDWPCRTRISCHHLVWAAH